MANKTLLDVANQRLTAAMNDRTTATAALAAAQTDLPAKQKQQTAAAAAAADLAAQEAAVRAQLAQVQTQAAGEALLVQLEQLTMSSRAAQITVLAAGDAVFAAQQVADEARMRAQDADAELTAATAAQAAAERDDAARAVWKTTAKNSTVPADATAALAATPYKNAKAALVDFVPDPLQTRALDRAKAERQRVDLLATRANDAQVALGTQLAANGGGAGAIEAKRVVFTQRAAALREFSASAQERLSRALSLLTVVLNAPKPDAADATAIQTAVDNAKSGTDAFDAEAQRDTAAAALRDAQVALEAKQLAKLADPKVDTSTEDKAVADATGALQQKQTAYSQALRDKVDKAEATVTDDVWRVVAAFEEADSILTELKAENPGKRADDADAAEQDLVKAIDDEAAAAGTVSQLSQRARSDADAAAVAARSAPDHVFSALRGDG